MVCFIGIQVQACGSLGESPPDVVALNQLPPLSAGGGAVDEATRGDVERYADAHPDVYAGRFLAEGHMYIGFTRDAAGNLRALRSGTANPSQIRAYNADFTYRQLVQLRDRILSDQSWFAANGIQLEGWGPDDYHNRELIELSRLDWWWMAQIDFRYGYGILRFEQRRPGSVVLAADACLELDSAGEGPRHLRQEG